jgi:hypothetical protein
MDTRGWTNLRQLSRHTTVPYQTLWSWKKATRNLRRPPAAPILKKVAEDLNLSESMVFRAAGRDYPRQGALDDGELQVLHLYQELTPEDKELAESMLRNLAERIRSQPVTRK